ncbi:MAG: hypothetical protein ACRERV_16110 [Methylococcales bacterium]
MNDMIDKDRISRCCWQLLVLSALALSIFPETFVISHWLGQTWLWLIATPVSVLFVIHRHRFAAAWSTALVYSPSRRRRQSSQAQARRKGFGRTGVRQSPMRAA